MLPDIPPSSQHPNFGNEGLRDGIQSDRFSVNHSYFCADFGEQVTPNGAYGGAGESRPPDLIYAERVKALPRSELESVMRE